MEYLKQKFKKVSCINDVLFIEKIESPEEAENLMHGLNEYSARDKGIAGVVVEGLEQPEYQWGRIRRTDYLLQAASHNFLKGLSLSYVDIPTAPFYLPKIKEAPIPSEIRMFDALVREMNLQAFLNFSFRLKKDVEEILANLPVTATEEYSLEGLLKDFQIEMTSPFLKASMYEVQEIFEKACLLEPASSEALNYESRIIQYRQFLTRLLSIQYTILKSIGESILLVIEAHPELADFYEKITFYRMLLQDQVSMPGRQPLSWSQKQLYLHLLARKMNFASLTIGEERDLGFRIVVSLKLALDELIKRYPFHAVFEMAVNWDAPGDFSIKLKKLLWEALNRSFGSLPKGEGEYNQEMLNFLPSEFLKKI